MHDARRSSTIRTMNIEIDGSLADALADALGPPCGQVALIGAASARWVEALGRRWPDAVIVDAMAGRAGADSIGGGVADGIAEAIVLLDATQPDAHSTAAIADASRTLRGGGHLTVVVQAITRLGPQVVDAPSDHVEPAGLRAGRPPSTYLRWLIDCGLRDVTTIDLHPPDTICVRGSVDSFHGPDRSATT